MIKFLSAISLCLLCSVNYAQNKNQENYIDKKVDPKKNTASPTVNLPEDFPKYIDTGNPSFDIQDYINRKQEWINNNPEKYAKISNGEKELKIISKEELAKMPAEKRNQILSQPDKYIVK